MQKHDDAVWESLCQNKCNFMNKTNARTLCKNTYNMTGRCNRRSCPLANSRHATITQLDGIFYLRIKRTEGAIGWGLVQLWSDYDKALESIDKYLEDFPEALVHRVKRRLTKMTRIRDLTLKMSEMTITDPSKKKKREVAVYEKRYEIKSLESRRMEVMRLKWRARKNPPRRVFAIGGRKVTQKSLQMMIPSRMLIMDAQSNILGKKRRKSNNRDQTNGNLQSGQTTNPSQEEGISLDLIPTQQNISISLIPSQENNISLSVDPTQESNCRPLLHSQASPISKVIQYPPCNDAYDLHDKP